jgi:hypothetical protein
VDTLQTTIQSRLPLRKVLGEWITPLIGLYLGPDGEEVQVLPAGMEPESKENGESENATQGEICHFHAGVE